MPGDERPIGMGKRREEELPARNERVEAVDGRAVWPVDGGHEERLDPRREGPNPVGA